MENNILPADEQNLVSSLNPLLGDPITVMYNESDGMVTLWQAGVSEPPEPFTLNVSYDPESRLFTNPFFCQVVDGEIIFRQDLVDAYLAEQELARKRTEAQTTIDYATPLINRHRDEIELGDPTTLTTEQYRTLLRQRNEAVTFLNNNPL